VARFPSDGGTGFLIGGFAQKMFEHQSKNTANKKRREIFENFSPFFIEIFLARRFFWKNSLIGKTNKAAPAAFII